MLNIPETLHKYVVLLSPLIAVITGFLVGAILIYAAGANPIEAYWYLFIGSFGSLRNIGDMLAEATPMLLTGLGVIVAFRCKVYNIGSEGQFYMGAIAASALGLVLGNAFSLPLLIIVGILAGGFWGAIPALLKAKLRVNEVITTVMLNYVALLFVGYLVSAGGPMQEPGAGIPWSPPLPVSALIPKIIPGTRIHLGLIFALLSAALVHFVLWRTTIGYEIRAVGSSREAAAYGTIDVVRNIVLAMIISGALAGLAGMIQVTAVYGRLDLERITRMGRPLGYGYMGIITALMGRLSPLWTVFASLLFAVLAVGGEAMNRAIPTLPAALLDSIQGIILLVFIGMEYLGKFKK